MSKIKPLKRVSMIVLGLNLLIQPIQATTVSVEKMYDSKIRAIQQLPNTYVVANYICDFNNDGVKDLLVSTWKSDEQYYNGRFVHNTIYTYKNNQMIKLNDELDVSTGRRHEGYALSIVSSKDGKQNVIKYTESGDQGGEGYENVYYYKLDSNNKLVEYIRKEYESDSAGRNIFGERKAYYMNGKAMTQNQYEVLTKVFVNARGLYTTHGIDGPTIWAYADQYNNISVKEFKQDERNVELERLYFKDRNKK